MQMSRTRGRRTNNVKLPESLQRELGLDHKSRHHVDRRKKVSSGDGNRTIPGTTRKDASRHRASPDEEHVLSTDDEHKAVSYDSANPSQRLKTNSQKSEPSRPISILKKNVRARHVESESLHSDDGENSRDSSPGLVLDASSRSFKTRAAQEEAEIAALEKRLGMKKKKLTSMGDDMLDYLLDGLDEEDSGPKRQRENDDWLDRKRRRINDVNEPDEDDLNDEEAVTLDDVEDDTMLSENTEDELEDDADGSDFDGFGADDDSVVERIPARKIKENPYVAPVAAGSTTTKYIPPSLRKRGGEDDESLIRLRRQVQGHLNKLSEANMVSILGEIENLYRNNPRQDVTSVLIDLLMASFCNRSALQNTYIILHAAFTVAIYKVVGTDFGAELLVRLVENFDKQYRSEGTGKEALNLISLLANLFTFNLLSSHIVFDHIRMLLSDFDESSAELLLRIVRDCGPQLRSEDPAALKGIVQMMQDISAEKVKNGLQLNVRTRVMMDTIIDLKNNKIKNAMTSAGATGEHITRMRKALGSLNSRNLKTTEPLRILRDDIANTEKKGKWWLVGASWKGNDKRDVDGDRIEEYQERTNGDADSEIDFMALAKRYRMNTDIRRSIFVAIVSGTDCRDAQTRLLKLRLTNKQEQEIAKVLLRCARIEPTYNPYYTLLAKNLSRENKRIRMALQFALWDFFRQMGERDDDDDDAFDDEGDDIELHEMANVARMYAYLIFNGDLTLAILKTLNIGFMKEQTAMFLEVLLISVMTQPKADDEQRLLGVFQGVASAPHIIKSLQYFMRKKVRRSDLMSKKDKRQVQEGCRVADAAFTALAATNLDSEI